MAINLRKIIGSKIYYNKKPFQVIEKGKGCYLLHIEDSYEIHLYPSDKARLFGKKLIDNTPFICYDHTSKELKLALDLYEEMKVKK